MEFLASPYCVMYKAGIVIGVRSIDVKYHKDLGFKVYKFAPNEELADLYAEQACYLPSTLDIDIDDEL